MRILRGQNMDLQPEEDSPHGDRPAQGKMSISNDSSSLSSQNGNTCCSKPWRMCHWQLEGELDMVRRIQARWASVTFCKTFCVFSHVDMCCQKHNVSIKILFNICPNDACLDCLELLGVPRQLKFLNTRENTLSASNTCLCGDRDSLDRTLLIVILLSWQHDL